MQKRGARILVVDDEFDDLKIMKDLLEMQGHKVVTATSGQKAIDILKGDKFSLVLIDILMPTLSGYELLKIIRAKYNHKIKLIYVSIVPKKEVEMNGADGFIQKPFTPEEFIAALNKALKK